MRNRNYDAKELDVVLQRLVETFGADVVLGEIQQVMSSDQLADVLTDVCDNWELDYMDN